MSKKEERLNSPDVDPQDLDSKSPGLKRRDFLRGSIAAATGVAATVAAGNSAASVTESALATGSKSESDKKEGYRLTKHIADYYKSAAI
jgi:hypothetical protein